MNNKDICGLVRSSQQFCIFKLRNLHLSKHGLGACLFKYCSYHLQERYQAKCPGVVLGTDCTSESHKRTQLWACVDLGTE